MLTKDNNGNIISPLLSLCEQKENNIDLIQYFIDDGADVNKVNNYWGTTITPLLSLCEQKEINVELIKYFIEHGIVINKGNPTPEYSLCQQKEITPNIFIIH